MTKWLLLLAASLPPVADASAASPDAPPAAPAAPRADLQSLVGQDDYPESALRTGAEGRVGFQLEVGADGRVRACMVTRSSGASALDAATCRIMRARARFDPARDGDGKPMPSRVEQQVSWALPPGTPATDLPVARPPAPGEWGQGMASHASSLPALTVPAGPWSLAEPSVIVPQVGPGAAELSVWTPGSDVLPLLGRYPSIAACREAKEKLALRAGQKAWCTIVPGDGAR